MQLQRNHLALLVVALTALLAALPQSAAAESATSQSVVEIPLGAKGKLLRQSGLRQRATRPAKLKNGRLVLKVSDIAITSGSKASIVLSGGLKLSHGRRSVKLQGLMLKVSGRNVTVDGRVGGKRVKLFVGRSSKQIVSAQTHQVSAATVRYSAGSAGAKALRRTLGLGRAPYGKLGSGTLFARVKLPSDQTGHGELVDLVGARLARPASAVNLSAASLKWWVRDSWIRYLPFNLPQDGASGDVPTQNHACKDNWVAQSDVYAFNLPFVEGWWDAASGTGALYYSGSVRWFFPDHAIDIVVSGAEVEINGANSRVIFRFDDLVGGTAKRGAFVALDLAAPINATPLTPGGGVSRLKATIFADPLTSPFGDFVTQYQSVPGWGCFDVGLSL